MSGSRAYLDLQFISTTAADYDGLALKFMAAQTPAYVSDTIFTFDDDAAPPSVANVVRIQGLATVVLIAAQMELSLRLVAIPNRFRCVNRGGGLLRLYQTVPGSDGNTLVDFTGDWSDLISINGVTDFAANDVYFYGGTSLDVPALWGPKRGMLLSGGADIPFAPISEL